MVLYYCFVKRNRPAAAKASILEMATINDLAHVLNGKFRILIQILQ